MCESVYMHTTKLYMYRLSDNFKSFFDLISTHTVYKLSNLNRTFVLVCTFTIQSFISYRQSMGPSHVWECVHTTKLYMYRLSDNFKSFFDLISTHTVYKLPNLNRTFVLVFKFKIQSFISCQQSMSPSHVSVKWQLELLFFKYVSLIILEVCESVHKIETQITIQN